MKRLALCLAAIGMLVGLQGIPCPAQQAARTVYMDQSRDWVLFTTGGSQGVRPLARELVRQALLVAARDELGLATRDAWLGASMPTEGDNAPWDVSVEQGAPAVVKILHGFSPDQTEICRHELPSSMRDAPHTFIHYRPLAELEETLSRTKFVDALKQAGFEGKPNVHDESVAVPDPVEKLLSQMNFLSQFRALKELHTIMRSRGESQAVLGALSRAYANLGMLTEYYWHPAHKIFKARAILYAQRMVARDESSPLAIWHRAYVAALVVDHRWALADLKQANELLEKVDPKTRPAQPPWVQLLEPLCRYDIPALGAHVNDPKLRELAALLKYLAVEQSGSHSWTVQTATETLNIVPDCDRVHDAMSAMASVNAMETATLEPLEVVKEKLYGQVQSMPGLPESVRRLVPRPSGIVGGTLNTPMPGDGGDLASEFRLRRQLIEALLNTDDLAPSEEVEPSWTALGLLVRELSFMQVYRRAHYQRKYLQESADEWLATTAPLVDGHPYQAFLDTYLSQEDRRQDALARLVQIDPVGVEGQAMDLYHAFDQDPAGQKFVNEFWRNIDYTVRDFAAMARPYSYGPINPQAKWLGQLILEISPQSPLGRILRIHHDWDSIKKKAPQWDKMCHAYPGLASELGDRYMMLQRWKDAERVYQAALHMLPGDVVAYRRLASAYEAQGQMDRWLATLEAYLKQPDTGFDHYSVHAQLAQHFLELKQWEKARPYAVAAAENLSAWGLSCAAECMEGLQSWDDAENYCRTCSQRYPGGYEALWYFFCRRTGQGDLAEARKLLQKAVEKDPEDQYILNPYDIVTFHLLEGAPDKAYPHLQHCVDAMPNSDDCFWLALLADRLKDGQTRDAALNQAKSLAQRPEDKPNATTKAIVAVADLLIQDLQKGGHGQIDLEAADRLITDDSLSDTRYISFQYVMGDYLNRHGKRDAADRYFKRCMESRLLTARYRTLAGATLLEHGIKPADYKQLLQPGPREAKKAAAQSTARDSKPQVEATEPNQASTTPKAEPKQPDSNKASKDAKATAKPDKEATH